MSSIGQIAIVAPYSGDMLPSVARSAIVRNSRPGPKNSTNLPTTPSFAQALGDRQHQVGRGRAFGQAVDQPEADDLGNQHRDRLAEHRGLRLDAADAPAHHAKPVHHRRVRVGADERVGIGQRAAVSGFREDHAREVLEIDLMDDAGVGRNDAEILEGLLPPAQEHVALAVPC